MKKLLSLLMTAAMALSLCACGGKPDSGTPSSTPDRPEEQAEEAGDPVKAGAFQCSLSNVSFADALSFDDDETFFTPSGDSTALVYKPKGETNRFLSFALSMTYTGSQELSLTLSRKADAPDAHTLGFSAVDGTETRYDTFAVAAPKGSDPGEWTFAGSAESGPSAEAIHSDAFRFTPSRDDVHRFRVAIEVPKEVSADPSAPLTLHMNLLGDDYTLPTE